MLNRPFQAKHTVAPALGPSGGMVFTVWPVTGGPPTTRELPVMPDQYNRWQGGEYVQDALANLTAADREWLMTGMDADTWDRLFKEDDA
jgi:hypothetical protein